MPARPSGCSPPRMLSTESLGGAARAWIDLCNGPWTFRFVVPQPSLWRRRCIRRRLRPLGVTLLRGTIGNLLVLRSVIIQWRCALPKAIMGLVLVALPQHSSGAPGGGPRGAPESGRTTGPLPDWKARMARESHRRISHHVGRRHVRFGIVRRSGALDHADAGGEAIRARLTLAGVSALAALALAACGVAPGEITPQPAPEHLRWEVGGVPDRAAPPSSALGERLRTGGDSDTSGAYHPAARQTGWLAPGPPTALCLLPAR